MKRFLLGLFFVSFLCLAVSDRTSLVSKSEVSVTTSSTLILAANLNRNYLLIQNRGSASIYVKFGSAHSGGEVFVEIAAGGFYEPTRVSGEAVYMKSASGTQSVTVLAGDQP